MVARAVNSKSFKQSSEFNWQIFLGRNEKLEWAGKSKGSFSLRKLNISKLFFFTIWNGFVVFFISKSLSVVIKSTSTESILPSLMFIIIPLVFIGIGIASVISNLKNAGLFSSPQQYALTNRRILITQSGEIQSIPITKSLQIRMTNNYGSDNIYFDNRNILTRAENFNNWVMEYHAHNNEIPAFSRIADGQIVYQKIIDIQATLGNSSNTHSEIVTT